MDFSPFSVSVRDSVLDDLRARLAHTRWPDQISGAGWSYGSDLQYMQGLCDYWASSFDWRASERRLNEFPQFTTTIDGQRIHFIHVRSPESNARPLLLLHGWPSSVLEFMKIIGPLSDPVAHGGTADQAFDVIVPSLPGFGWSGQTTERGWHAKRIADAFAELMSGLGYGTFSIHGGDYGAVVAGLLGADHTHRIEALHLTFLVTGGLKPEDGEPTAEERQLFEVQRVYNATETAYISMQSTKPQTIAYALADSPVALAAWIVEKFNAWTDNEGDLESAISTDEILANITTYWVTGTGGSSARLYFESAAAGFRGPNSLRLAVPTSVAVFPKEPYRTSRRIAEHHYNVVRWTEMPRGGHFPASEQPELLIADIRSSLAAMIGN